MKYILRRAQEGCFPVLPACHETGWLVDTIPTLIASPARPDWHIRRLDTDVGRDYLQYSGRAALPSLVLKSERTQGFYYVRRCPVLALLFRPGKSST